MRHKGTRVTVDSFEMTFHHVRLPFGLELDSVHLVGPRAMLDSEPFGLDLEEAGRVRVVIKAESVEEFLNRESPGGLKDFGVRLHDGKVYVDATATVILPIRASATCSLEIRHGTKIYVVLEHVDVMGVGAKGLVESQLERINPVVDVDEFPLWISLQKVHIHEGELILTGLAKPKS